MSDTVTYLSRRRFLLASAGALGPMQLFSAEQGSPAMPWDGPAVVRKVYLGGRAGWPRPDANVKENVAAIEAEMAKIERSYPDRIRFTGGDIVGTKEEMAAWLQRPAEEDVVLAFNMVTITYPLLRMIVDTGRPTLMFALPYNGHDWTHGAALAQRGFRFDLVASSDFGDLAPYVDLFRTIHHMRHSKVLLVSPPAARPKTTEEYTQQFGTRFGFPPYTDLKTAYDGVPEDQVRKLTAAFIKAAAKVVEPPEREIADSIRMDFAIREVLKAEKANAIAIDCLGGFGRKELPAYPCIAFSKLNDVGLYGVCENDMDSAMTQLLVTSFSGKPGFVSDPVFDTSKDEVIHAHCVAATRLTGIREKPAPYIVRTHLEDHKGVSMQVLAPAGGPVTVARFAGAKKIMLSTGECLGNVDDERGCRTKIRTRVKDSRKLLENWAGALHTGPAMPGTRDLLHRVVFYGDHVKPIERLGC
jgi:hypothetical protein